MEKQNQKADTELCDYKTSKIDTGENDECSKKVKKTEKDRVPTENRRRSVDRCMDG